MTVVLGIDCQPTRLGIATYTPGGHKDCWVERLDINGGGWDHQQMARAIRSIRERHPGLEPVVVGIEDGAQGSRGRTVLAAHERTKANLIASLVNTWPHLTPDQFRWWGTHKGGESSTTDSAPSAWKVWAGVKWPRDKAMISGRAARLRFPIWDVDTKVRQDACDAACIAVATYKWWAVQEHGDTTDVSEMEAA